VIAATTQQRKFVFGLYHHPEHWAKKTSFFSVHFLSVPLLPPSPRANWCRGRRPLILILRVIILLQLLLQQQMAAPDLAKAEHIFRDAMRRSPFEEKTSAHLHF
jgi:hypothetical protein